MLYARGDDQNPQKDLLGLKFIRDASTQKAQCEGFKSMHNLTWPSSHSKDLV